MYRWASSLARPMSIPPPRLVMWTTSSATSRCPRSTRSSTHSLFPIPERPMNSTAYLNPVDNLLSAVRKRERTMGIRRSLPNRDSSRGIA